MKYVFPILLFLILFALAGIHIYWAAGGFWPGDNLDSLMDTIYGYTPEGGFPALWLTALVIIGLLAAPFLVVYSNRPFQSHALSILMKIGGWGVIAVFTLRGIVGFFMGSIEPQIAGSDFEYLNRMIYSPLCLLIAAMAFCIKMRSRCKF